MLGVALVGSLLDQQVGRLDVAVYQAAPVRGVECPGRLTEQEHGLIGRQRPALLEHLP